MQNVKNTQRWREEHDELQRRSGQLQRWFCISLASGGPTVILKQILGIHL